MTSFQPTSDMITSAAAAVVAGVRTKASQMCQLSVCSRAGTD